MSYNAQRYIPYSKPYSKRQVRRRVASATAELNARVEKRQGRIIITPKAVIKGHVKWTAAIRRAIRPLAEQFGLKVQGSSRQLVCQ
jgi:hypothetical protein